MRVVKLFILLAGFLALVLVAMVGTYAAIRGPEDYHTEVDKVFRAVTAPYWSWRQAVMDGEERAAKARQERDRIAAINARKPHSRALSASERAVVEAAVRRALRDPSSAVFEHTRVFTSNAPYEFVGKYCLLVNARNGFGGYAGSEPFLMSIPDEGLINYASVQKFSDDAKEFCLAYAREMFDAIGE